MAIMTETAVSLLQRLRLQPDPASWQRLTDLYAPWLRGWLYRAALPQADAEDLVQELLALLTRELPGFQDDQRPGAFRRWLRMLMVNGLRNFWYAQRTRPLARGDSNFEKNLEQLADPGSSLSRLWDEEHDPYVARRMLELLKVEFDPTTWRAFQLLVLEGKRTLETAAELGISPSAVRIAKSRIQSRLRQEAEGLID
jgi:RNA polymerase sigma-70 factor (ECF subfamily)